MEEDADPLRGRQITEGSELPGWRPALLASVEWPGGRRVARNENQRRPGIYQTTRGANQLWWALIGWGGAEWPVEPI